MRETWQHDDLLNAAVEAVARLRVDGARVHCLTNSVAQAFTANLLLAAGATPSMTMAREEIRDFASRADAVLINLGTLDADRMAAMEIAARLCHETPKPFLLDPVMCHLSPLRRDFAIRLLQYAPSAMRSNAEEAEAVSTAIAGLPAGMGIPCQVITGSVDRILHDGREWQVANGHHWLSRITAAGCAEGALMAALAAVAENLPAASLAALLWVNVAAENAAGTARGPGSFQAALLDCIHDLEPAELMKRAKLNEKL